MVLDREVASGGCFLNKEESIESAYEDLWKHLQDVMGPVQGNVFEHLIGFKDTVPCIQKICKNILY